MGLGETKKKKDEYTLLRCLRCPAAYVKTWGFSKQHWKHQGPWQTKRNLNSSTMRVICKDSLGQPILKHSASDWQVENRVPHGLLPNTSGRPQTPHKGHNKRALVPPALPITCFWTCLRPSIWGFFPPLVPLTIFQF